MSSSNCCFLTCIQVSQEAGQAVWYSHLLKNFPQFVVIHTVKGSQNLLLVISSDLCTGYMVIPTVFKKKKKEPYTYAMRTSLVRMLCVCAQSLSPVLCSPMNCKPARLLCPLDFPGKNIGVCCHFLLQGIFPTQGTNLCLLHWQANSLSLSHLGSYVCYVLSRSVMSSSLRPHGLYSLPGSSVHGDSRGKNTRVGCHALLWRIFPTQGPNPGLPHWEILDIPT